MENNQEIKLIGKVKRGDATAFNLLINNYRRKLFGYLLKLSGDRTAAEDLLQETLIKVWRGIKKYKEQSKFSSWLFSIAHNINIDAQRKVKSKSYVIIDKELPEYSSNNNPASDLEAKEIKIIIQNIVNGLPEKQKNVFLLRQHGELAFKEISEITKESLNTVLSHMHYAVKKIKKELREKDAI